MSKNITIKIEPRHFAAAPDGYQGDECPLGQALREMFPDEFIAVSAFRCFVGNSHYEFDICEWGGAFDSFDNRSLKLPGELISTLCEQAKISLEGIPTVELELVYNEAYS